MKNAHAMQQFGSNVEVNTMEAKEKKQEQKQVAQSVTKEQAEHEEKIKKRWAVKFGPKFKKNKK